MARIKVRKGMPSVALTKAEFTARARERFFDPAFDPLQAEIGKIIDAAWNGYHEYRKAPRTRKAGRGYADPAYDLSIDWLKARDAIARAERRQKSSDDQVAHPADQRLDAQRPELPRRDVQDLAAGRDGAPGDRARARLRGRGARSQPADLAVRPADPSLQGLRVDGAAALPLAVLLLSQPCDGPGQ